MTKQRHEEPTSSRATMFVMAIGGILVAALVGWALTRSVEPALPVPPPSAAGEVVTTSSPVTTATQDDSRAAVPRITPESLQSLIQNKDVTVIDVRDEIAYVTEHIPGALHVPFARVQAEVSRIPKNKRVVIYCTWPAEESSAGAALIMARSGFFNVSALHGGLDAWKKKGFPTETGEPPAL